MEIGEKPGGSVVAESDRCVPSLLPLRSALIGGSGRVRQVGNDLGDQVELRCECPLSKLSEKS